MKVTWVKLEMDLTQTWKLEVEHSQESSMYYSMVKRTWSWSCDLLGAAVLIPSSRELIDY